MNSVYLICYGDSEENIDITFEKKVIGSANHARIPEGKMAYLVVKRNGEWMIVGNAKVGKETDTNPFKKPNKYKTYDVTNIKKCTPFSISSICKSELGNQYGLVLRSPQPITAEGFVKYLESNFH